MASVSRFQRILLSVSIAILFSLVFFIVFSNNGLLEVYSLKKSKARLIESSQGTSAENLSLCRTLDRLKFDPEYIGTVARQELGMIGKDEIIIRFLENGKKKPLHE